MAREKHRLREIVLRREWPELNDVRMRPKKVLRGLVALLYDPDESVRARAAEAVGHVAKRVGAEDPEWVRQLILRLFWSLNEESGSIGWGAALALGEIGASVPEIMRAFQPCVMAMLGAEGDPIGALQAAGRIADFSPDLREDAMGRAAALLRDESADVRAHAAWALGRMKAGEARDQLEKLVHDPHPAAILENGERRHATVGDFACEALARIAG